MSTTTSQIDTTALDFDSIHDSIVLYLQSKKIFKSVNFTAPAISLLIDALTYITYYISTYCNFALTESNLSTAQLRQNIVAQAKMLNYIPSQKSTARAYLKIKYSGSGTPTSETYIPNNTEFTGSDTEGNSYIFRTIKDYFWDTTSTSGPYYIDATIYEGSYITDTFTFTESGRYILSNKNIDLDYVKVIVYNINDVSGNEYTIATSLSDYGPTKRLYYIEENYDGYIEIYFGDDKLSAKPVVNSTISVTYLVSNGSSANNIDNFSFVTPISYASIYSTTQPSETGGDRESNDSIKFNAPRYLQSQDRAVTTRDYNTLILKKFNAWIDSIIVWGGEDNTPKYYGFVMICIKPKYSTYISSYQENLISDYLSDKSLPCISYKFVDPIYIYTKCVNYIDWKYTESTITQSTLSDNITSTILSYFQTYQTDFESKFKYSNFLNSITEISDTIDNVYTDFTLIQYFTMETNTATNYEFNFLNKIKTGSVSIGPWIVNSNNTYKIIDNGSGSLYLYIDDVKFKNVGSVDYDNGIISLNNYKFDTSAYYQSFNNTFCAVSVKPFYQNINLKQNYILTTEKSYISNNIELIL